MAVQGSYEAHILAGMCPSVNGDLMCSRHSGHPVNGSTERHQTPVFVRPWGSEYVEWD